MDNPDGRYYRGSGAASRPPESERLEDTPLFTDITYTPSHRAGNNGRPDAAPSRAASLGRSSTASSPYGGRSYSPPARSAQTQRRTASPAEPAGRSAPVYTELSWDDLMRGTDINELGRPGAAAHSPREGAFPAAPAQPRTGSQYFGGFDQEMEELFYGRAQSAAPSSAQSRDGQPARQGYASPAQTAPARPAYSRTNVPRLSVQPTPSYRPQTTARRTTVQDNTPAPAQRPAFSRTKPQWSGVFGRTASPEAPQRPTERTAASRQTARPAAPVRSVGGGTPPTGGRGRANYNARPRRIPPVFLGGGLVLVALLVFLIARLAGDSSSTPRPASAPTNMYTPVPAASVEPAVTPEPEAELTPAPTPEPTPTPSGPKAKKSGDLIVPADWGPSIPARSRAVYDSFFDKSCMVGNSLVEGFFMWSGMTNLRYIYHTGATVNDAMGKLDLAPITLNPAGYYDNIYLLFGLNEIGTDVNSFVQGYKKLVDFIRQYQPTANIILISVTPVTRQVDGDPNEVQSMDRIRTFNAALQEFCVDQNCWYLDIYNLLLDKDGYLSGDYAFVGDGKHFEKSGYVAWANYMKTHYVDEKLLTE